MASGVTAKVLFLGSLMVLTHGVCKKEDQLTTHEKEILDAHNKYRAKHEDTDNLCYGAVNRGKM